MPPSFGRCPPGWLYDFVPPFANFGLRFAVVENVIGGNELSVLPPPPPPAPPPPPPTFALEVVEEGPYPRVVIGNPDGPPDFALFASSEILCGCAGPLPCRRRRGAPPVVLMVDFCFEAEEELCWVVEEEEGW